MSNEVKIFLGVVVGTLALVFGASFLLGRSGGQSGTTNPSGQNVAPADVLVRPDSHKIGTDSAKVTIVEFSDFQCPSCKAAEPEVETLLAKYKDRILFVYRHFPLPAHQYGFPAAEAAEAAGLQGKFWTMRAKLFAFSPDLSIDKLKQAAKDLGLDMNKFNQDLDSDTVRQKVLNDQSDGNSLGVNATPTFYVNGKQFVGISGLDSAVSDVLK